MKKVRATLPLKQWAGLVTKYPAASTNVSPDEFSAGTSCVDTSVRGIITKSLGGVTFGSGATKFADQFEAIFVDGTRYLLVMDNGALKYTAGDGVLTTIKSGYTAAANMEFAMHGDRVYFCNGVSAAQVLDRTVSYGGAYAVPVTLTVVDYTGLAGDTVKIGTTTKTEGANWTAATSNNATATSLATALSAISGVTASAVAAVVTVTSETPSIVVLSDAVNLTVASLTSPRVKAAGAQVPTTTLTAAVGAGGNVVAGTYTYKVTYVYYNSSESNGSTASGAVAPGVSSQINLTAIPIGGYGVTSRKIYRSDGTTGYRFVLEILNNTATTGTDNLAVGLEFIPTDNGILPQFKYITHHLDRLWMGGVSGRSSDLFFTEAGKADITLSTDYVTANSQDPITAVSVYQDHVITLNRTSFGVIYGDTSDTFRYAPVPGSIGCVDNRSVQVRTLSGLPTLMWLSDKGFYIFNGSTVEYISDRIETLVNFNLQQADFSKGSHTDSTQADFTAGTSSPAILLTSPSGSITVPNPKSVYDTEAVWEAASSFTNLVTHQTSTQDPSRIGTPAGNIFDYVNDSDPATSNVSATSSTLSLVAGTDFTGAGSTTTGGIAYASTFTRIATAYTVVRAGVIGLISAKVNDGISSHGLAVAVWSDSAGTPGTILFQGPTNVAPGVDAIITGTASYHVSAGQTIWIGVVVVAGSSAATKGVESIAGPGKTTIYQRFSDGGFTTVGDTALSTSFAFVQDAVPSSGLWMSDAINVGFLNTNSTANIYLANGSASYPGGVTSSTTYIDSSNDPAFGSYDTVSTADLNGQVTLVLARRLHYRVRIALVTTDDRYVPTFLFKFNLSFGQNSMWTGATVDHTTDITAMNSLTVVASLPAGSSGSVTITKSTDNITYTDQGTFTLADGSQVFDLSTVTNPTRCYTRVRFNLVSNQDPTMYPLPTVGAEAQISSATLKVTTVSTFTSADIDVGTTPAGWDIFTTETSVNGGTVTYTMRSSVGGGSGSYIAVTSGDFPVGVTPLRHAQWKVSITATADNVPVIGSVTVGWLIGSAASSIRAASLFYNRTYYIAVAQMEKTANDIVLVYDQNGKWYRYDGLSFATMGVFFNRPLVTLAATPTMVRWLSGTTNQGTNITLDFRTKALDFDDTTKTKIFRGIKATVGNTGATWTFTYSVDGGLTFLALVDYTGATSFTTGTDGQIVPRTFVPQWPNQISGRTIMIRGVSSDAFDAWFYELAVDAFIRESEPTHV